MYNNQIHILLSQLLRFAVAIKIVSRIYLMRIEHIHKPAYAISVGHRRCWPLTGFLSLTQLWLSLICKRIMDVSRAPLHYIIHNNGSLKPSGMKSGIFIPFIRWMITVWGLSGCLNMTRGGLMEKHLFREDDCELWWREVYAMWIEGFLK